MIARAITVVMVLATASAILLVPSTAAANDALVHHDNRLLDELGRNESRVWADALELEIGGVVSDYDLASRLDRLGYRRVRGQRPSRAGEYFYGNEIFWVFRRAHRWQGKDLRPELLGLVLAGGGRIAGFQDRNGLPLRADSLRLEPELLAESLDRGRARRLPFRLDEAPEHLWRAVLAAEDHRFFDHVGVDGRSVARALLANVKAGGVSQGGSTITQQLVKNRDLTPRRTVGRKASEAARALALEAQYDKHDILEAYLDQVYLGHVDGLAIHGFATASRAYFSLHYSDLDIAQSALLAAIIQAPNRMAPQRHPERAKTRRDWVIGRLEELGWIEADPARRARDQPVALKLTAPPATTGSDFVAWVSSLAESAAPKRTEQGRGLVIETTLDPLLQEHTERAVAEHLAALRRDHRRLRSAPLAAAVISLDAASGAVLAYVAGAGEFDRVRQARRQPGSAIKPFLLLEAFERCGQRQPLAPANRVADEALTIDLPTGPWQPQNSDGELHGIVSIRDMLVESLNIPAVRIARWCGFDATADRLRKAGLQLPAEPPPAFALGAIETSPRALAEAFSVMPNLGRRVGARPISRLERPGGRRLGKRQLAADKDRVARPDTTYLVHDLLRDAAERGTARAASIDGIEVAAKTGTTSDRRDAWLAGYANGVVTVVWVGRDDGQSIGLTGSRAAAPLWRQIMAKAATSRPAAPITRPSAIVERHVDQRTGLLVRSFNSQARIELFSKKSLPRRDRFWRDDIAEPIIR